MITPDDIRNSRRLSGYNGVRKSTGPKPFQANKRVAPGKNGILTIGRRRATAVEAAQDYCDYLNGRAMAPPASLKTAGHPRAERKPMSKAAQVALDILRDERAKPTDEGYVYLVVEEGAWLSGPVKIGWTTKNPPEARLGDYQAGNPRKLVMLAAISATKQLEKDLHRKYIADNVLGEWFRPTPALLSEFGIQMKEAA